MYYKKMNGRLHGDAGVNVGEMMRLSSIYSGVHMQLWNSEDDQVHYSTEICYQSLRSNDLYVDNVYIHLYTWYIILYMYLS